MSTDTRDKILQAAFTVLSRQGYENASIKEIAADVAAYVPGYRLRTEPQFDDPTPMSGGRARVAVFVEVEGAGDFLPPYSGNLDIMTAAASRVGEGFATRILAARA